ncbi:18760_t:CDS:2, partial [Funneliformis geosporum]
KKVKCSEGPPCTNCKKKGINCIYVPGKKRGRKVKREKTESSVNIDEKKIHKDHRNSQN